MRFGFLRLYLIFFKFLLNSKKKRFTKYSVYTYYSMIPTDPPSTTTKNKKYDTATA